MTNLNNYMMSLIKKIMIKYLDRNFQELQAISPNLQQVHTNNKLIQLQVLAQRFMKRSWPEFRKMNI